MALVLLFVVDHSIIIKDCNNLCGVHLQHGDRSRESDGKTPQKGSAAPPPRIFSTDASQFTDKKVFILGYSSSAHHKPLHGDN